MFVQGSLKAVVSSWYKLECDTFQAPPITGMYSPSQAACLIAGRHSNAGLKLLFDCLVASFLSVYRPCGAIWPPPSC